MSLLSLEPFSLYTLLGIGLIFIGIEMSLNSFYILWFGIGFCVVGVLEYFMPFPSAIHQLVTVSTIALILLFTLKNRVKALLQKSEKEIRDNFLNETGIGIIKHGMVEFKGTLWEIDPEFKSLKNDTQVQVLETKANRAIIKALLPNSKSK